MLGDFEHEAVAVILGFESRENGGQFALEGHVDDGADDLADFAGWGGGHGVFLACYIDVRALLRRR